MVHGIEIGPEPSTGYNLRQMVDQNTEDLQRVAFDFQSQCWMQVSHMPITMRWSSLLQGCGILHVHGMSSSVYIELDLHLLC